MYLNYKKGSKPGTIIMLHGSSSSSRVYQALFESEIKHSLISFDFYGHGKSERNGKYGMEDMKQQLFGVLEKTDDDVMLLGNSLGGHIAMEAALDIKNMKALVLFGTPPVKKPINVEEAFNPIPEFNTFFTPQPSDAEINAAINVAVYNKDVRSILKDDFIQTDKEARAILGQQLGEFSDELEILHQLKCEKFMICGENDPTTNMDYLQMNISFGGYEIIEFKECGHYPSIEKPKEFLTYIEKISNIVFK